MPFILRDAQISAEFSSCGELLSLKNEETGTELIRPGFPWKLILTRGSSLEEELPPDGNRPEIRQAGNRLEMNFDALRGRDGTLLQIRLAIVVELEAGELRWKILLENEDPRVMVRECMFPVVTFSEAALAMKLHTAHQGGEVLDDLRGTLAAVKPLYQQKDERFRRLIFHYPGSSLATNSFLFANGEEGGYFGCHDPSFQETLHVYERSAAGEVSFYFDRIPFLKTGETREYSGYLTSPYSGRWHDGALKYRKWAETWLDFRTPPPWVKTMQGWQRIIARTQYGETLYRFRELGRVFDDGLSAGIDTLFLLGWHQGGHDNDYPNYIPSAELGGEGELKENIRRIRARGGHVILYCNGQLIDRTSEFYRTTGRGICCRDMYGNEITERWGFGGDGVSQRQYGARSFAVACPSSEEWFELLKGMVDRAVEYGCDGIFFDQIGKAAPVCWSPEHGHPVPFVESTQYRADQIRRLREYANARAPEMSFGVEHVTDLTAQYCDYVHPYPGGANLRNPDWKKRGERPRIDIDREWFRFLFPEVRLSNRDLRDGSDVVRRVNRMILDNLLADVEIYRCRKTIAEIPEYREYLRKALDFRNANAHLLTEARFRSTVDFSVDSDELDTAGFRTPTGDIVVMATQCHRPEIRFHLTVPQARLVGHSFLGEGEVASDGEVRLKENALVLLHYHRII